MKEILKTITNSSRETMEAGIKFSRQLLPGDIVCFYGNLGSGKTTLIRGICEGLGSTEIISSPTFTLINEYKGSMPIYHFDFYRLNSENELTELGLDEYLYGSGVCLIEWPEIIKSKLNSRYEIYMQWNFKEGWENKRELVIQQI